MSSKGLRNNTIRVRLIAVAIIAVVLVAGTGWYLASSRAEQLQQTAAAPAQASVSLATVRAGPRIVFRNAALGSEYGVVSMVPIADPAGPRAFTDTACDRVFATAAETLCLASDRGVVTTYSAKVVTDATGAIHDIPLTGSPSRARLSDDGSLSATTSFVAGDSYAATNFSTRTVVTHLGTGVSQDLEDFALLDNGQRIAPVDRNYWGVTFAADDDRFYLTVAFGGVTHLAMGRLSTQTVETVRQDAECPSLSPNGTKVAYKKRGDRARGDWRVTVLDLTTGTETQLSETRSVDDQVEWLDDHRILYGLPGAGSQAAESNVWVVNADGTGSPTLLIPQAWSPAVVR
ncbi:MAG: hypothetical protein ABI112_15515 [Terracoccus sp.]